MDLDGKLVGPWVEELRESIGASGGRESLCLNLRRLTFADSAGLSLLQELRRDGAQLVGALPLIEALLAMHGQAIDERLPRTIPA
jgi:anti-anti-sigma regulatory factor